MNHILPGAWARRVRPNVRKYIRVSDPTGAQSPIKTHHNKSIAPGRPNAKRTNNETTPNKYVSN